MVLHCHALNLATKLLRFETCLWGCMSTLSLIKGSRLVQPSWYKYDEQHDNVAAKILTDIWPGLCVQILLAHAAPEASFTHSATSATLQTLLRSRPSSSLVITRQSANRSISCKHTDKTLRDGYSKSFVKLDLVIRVEGHAGMDLGSHANDRDASIASPQREAYCIQWLPCTPWPTISLRPML